MNSTVGVMLRQCVNAMKLAFGHTVNITRDYIDPETLREHENDDLDYSHGHEYYWCPDVEQFQETIYSGLRIPRKTKRTLHYTYNSHKYNVK